MKIAFLTTRPPYPPHSGNQSRCFNIARRLAERHDLYLLSFLGDESERDDLLGAPIKYRKAVGLVGARTTAWSAVRSSLSPLPMHVWTHRNPLFRSLLASTIEKEGIDVIYSNLMYFGQYLDADPRKRVLTILDQQNLDRDWWDKLARLHPNRFIRLFSRWNLKKTMRFESAVYPRFDLCFCCAEKDLQGSRKISSHPEFALIPNGVDVSYFRPSKGNRTEPVILFTGTSADRNVVAMRFFHEKIFPLVRQRCPRAVFQVVGRIARDKVAFLIGADGVDFVGPVDDVRPYFSEARVFVSPFTLGGGTKLKVLEAMAMGKPVVGTSTGCQGITMGKGAMVADDPAEFANALARILENDTLASSMSRAAREMAASKYDWDRIVVDIEAAMERHASRIFGPQRRVQRPAAGAA